MATPPDQGRDSAASPAVCKYFARFGRCNFGTNCRFTHSTASARLPVPPRASGASVSLGDASDTVRDLDSASRRWAVCNTASALPRSGFQFTFVT
jgi:hypothetical protein